MFYLHRIVSLLFLVFLGGCAIGPPSAEPGALAAANAEGWGRLGVQIYGGSQFYSDMLHLENATSPGAIIRVPEPDAGEIPVAFTESFANQIEKETGIETVIIEPAAKRLTAEQGMARLQDDYGLAAYVNVYIVSEGIYFPSSYGAKSSLTVYVTVYEVPSGLRLWDVKQRNSEFSTETSLARHHNGWSYAPFSYGVYEYSESGVVDYVSLFDDGDAMFIGAYDSAAKHIPRIVADLVADMGLTT